jgi:Flp pilus assembly protein TadG
MLARRTTSVAAARRGSAAVEFGIIAPFVVLLLVGMVEISRGLMVREALSNAARQACRSGILAAGTNAGMTAEVRATLDANALPGDKATVTIYVNGNAGDVTKAARGDRVGVRVTVPASEVNLTGRFFGSRFEIESETVTMMRQQ